MDMVRLNVFAVKYYDPNELLAFPKTFSNWAFCVCEYRAKLDHGVVE